MKKEPQSTEGEKGVLGSMLLDPERCIPKMAEKLDPGDFYNNRNKILFETLVDFYIESKTFDVVQFAEYIDKAGIAKKIGGLDYCLELQDHTLVPSHSEHYANMVLNASNLRYELKTLRQAVDDIQKGESVADDVIGALMKTPIEKPQTNENIIKQWKAAQSGTRVTIPTPYPAMDRQTGGIKQGMVTVFTGRSKSGKSMFLASWYNYLGAEGIPILVVPLEDRREVTICRMAANYGNYSNSELQAGGRYYSYNGEWKWSPVLDKDIERGAACLEHVSKYPVHFYDKKVTPKGLRSVCIRFAREHKVRAIFIDGAKDLLRPPGKYGDVGYDEEVSQALVEIANVTGCAVIAVWHLVKIDNDRRIQATDVRGSGNIISDCRALYCLQSGPNVEGILRANGYDIEYDEDGENKMRVFECISNNHGSTAMRCLVSNLERCQFEEATKS